MVLFASFSINPTTMDFLQDVPRECTRCAAARVAREPARELGQVRSVARFLRLKRASKKISGSIEGREKSTFGSTRVHARVCKKRSIAQAINKGAG